MRIEEQKVYRFVFPFLNGQGDSVFNIVAESQADAAYKLLGWMAEVQTELGIAFPRVAPENNKKTEKPAMEELKISTLIDDLSKYLAPVRDHDTSLTNNFLTIKEWLKMDYEPTNFVAIEEGLKELKKMYETGKIKKTGR